MAKTFAVVGKPQPKGSTRAFVVGWKPGQKARPQTVTTSDNPKLKAWEKSIKVVATDVFMGEPIEGAVQVRMVFNLLRPASVSPLDRPHPTVAPDTDKLARAVLDALTGIAYDDDAQVVAVSSRKRYVTSAAEGVVIECGPYPLAVNNPQE